MIADLLDPRAELDAVGFVIRVGAVAASQVGVLIAAASVPRGSPGERRRQGQTFAVRNLLWERPGFARLLADTGLTALATEALGSGARPVDATFMWSRRVRCSRHL